MRTEEEIKESADAINAKIIIATLKYYSSEEFVKKAKLIEEVYNKKAIEYEQQLHQIVFNDGIINKLKLKLNLNKNANKIQNTINTL